PATHLIAGTVLGKAASVVVAVLIALFAGELVWRERDVRVNEIADAAPAPDWVFFAGRLLALILMLAAVQAVLVAAGVLLQALQGYHRYELGLYLRILFGLKMVDYTLLAILAMAVHVVVNQKYLGHLIVVFSFVFNQFAASFGVEHNLLLYGSDPGWIYSDMNGFGPFVLPWVWFKLYWGAWALLLAVVARLFWVRGRAPGGRTAQARSRLTGGAAGAAGVAVLLILTLGGFIFYNTNVLNEYSTGLEADAPWAEYERRYKRYEGVPQPRILAAQLRVEIYPDEPAAELRGSYQLVNRTTQAIDSIHLIVLPQVSARSLSFDRAAERVVDDGDLQYQVYALDRPLLPGDSLRLHFDLTIRPRGFPNQGIPTAVVRNGTYFDRRWLPIVGYQPFLELKDAKTRQDHGLPHRPEFPAPTDAQALQHREPFHDAELVDVDMVIGTAADQIAVTSGTLRREWTENGRRYFHYRTEAPLPFDAAVLSARYAVREDRWKDVALRIYHHPTHTFNLDRMVRSMKASLDYNTTSFGPYPFPELRIVEFPLYASGARAHPHTIAFSEGSAFLTRVEEGDVDRPFFVVAHETAH
ncbi:MAG TPA: hypothetical protein VGR27_13365, partial [Longimicrobiaceae bacterium]|nr:hypothetical protein [Longimicrobiaceae bacterium]